MKKLFAPCFALLHHRGTRLILLGVLLVATLVVTGAVSPSRAHAASRTPLYCIDPCRQASQLIFIDFIGNTYSIRITGPNQYQDDGSTTTYNCLPTPGRKTTLANWWWATRTNVTKFSSPNCSPGTEVGTLFFDSDNAFYRCLENNRDSNPPFVDFDSNNGQCGTQYG
jgi:hypothetical protein